MSDNNEASQLSADARRFATDDLRSALGIADPAEEEGTGALMQQGEPQGKLGLVALALKANESGDGSLKLGWLAKAMGCEMIEAVGRLAPFVRRRLIVITYRGSDREDSAEDDVIEFGLCIDMGCAY